MLDVDDWAGINFQWNDVEAASDMGVTDSKPHSSEPEMMDNLPANNARTKKQLTLEINAAAGMYVIMRLQFISHRKLV